MILKTFPVMLLAAAVLLPAVGCGHIKTPAVAFIDDGELLPKDVGNGLVASPNPLIPDVPMPVGFKAVASQSFWNYDGRVRVVHHVYQGHANSGEAVNFYQLTLPANNWTLIDMRAIGDATVMRYAKGPEKLSVSARDGWAVSTITIDIEAR